MYDLHAHILPGLDDGAATIETSVEMARVAAEQGTRFILATPHRRDVTERSSVRRVRELADEVNRRVSDQGIDVMLAVGMENHVDSGLPGDVSRGRALPINGTAYILVEMPFSGYPDFVEPALERLIDQGLTPVLAHPERIEAFQQDPALLRRFVALGMLCQITAGSLVGHFGDDVRAFTEELLRENLAHVIASDTHAPGGPRAPHLRKGMDSAAKIVGVERAKEMVVDVPGQIFRGGRVTRRP